MDALTTWLSTVWDNLTTLFISIFGDVINVIMDMFIWIIDKLFLLIIIVVGLIPVPDLSNGLTLAGIAIQLPDGILWGIEILRLQECLTMITGAYVFYTLRRLMTLGHW